MKKNQKVFVGMSGGVDSGVSAALLQKAGYDVTGVFIKAWHPDFLPCTWREERRDAMRICAKLGIPFLTLDLEKEYKKEVVDYMVREYKTGRTPNPDVMCNKEIKFGYFLKFAKKKGADYVATGHYAQKKKIKGGYSLAVSKDTEKDQTYFLWTLSQRQLPRILFPVGDKIKNEVRKLAQKFDLPVAEKKDSQGLCFLGKIEMRDFLKHYIKPKKGKVLDVAGKTIGFHDGAVFLTIGQRHGFVVNNKKTESIPLYVVTKNISKNTITVSELKPDNIESLGARNITLGSTVWTTLPKKKTYYEVRLRYRQTLLKATIEKKKNKWVVSLDTPMVNISLGQSLVVYDKDLCVGGGVIESIK